MLVDRLAQSAAQTPQDWNDECVTTAENVGLILDELLHNENFRVSPQWEDEQVVTQLVNCLFSDNHRAVGNAIVVMTSLLIQPPPSDAEDCFELAAAAQGKSAPVAAREDRSVYVMEFIRRLPDLADKLRHLGRPTRDSLQVITVTGPIFAAGAQAPELVCLVKVFAIFTPDIWFQYLEEDIVGACLNLLYTFSQNSIVHNAVYSVFQLLLSVDELL